MVNKILLWLVLIVTFTVAYADSHPQDTLIKSLQKQITKLQLELFKLKKDSMVVPMNLSSPTAAYAPPPLQITVDPMMEIPPQRKSPWDEEGYQESVVRAQKTYTKEKSKKCESKIAKYTTRLELKPSNIFYRYQLERWKKQCD